MARSSKEILDEANELARRFYDCMGYKVAKGFRFDPESKRLNRHPHEAMCWEMAVVAFEALRETDLMDVLSDLDS